MSRPPKPTYKTTNWQAYNQALRQRGSLTIWFDPSMQWEAIPSGGPCRQHAYSEVLSQTSARVEDKPLAGHTYPASAENC